MADPAGEIDQVFNSTQLVIDEKLADDAQQEEPNLRQGKSNLKRKLIFVGIALFILTSTAFFLLRSTNSPHTESIGRSIIRTSIDEEEIKRVVVESQKFETLVIHANPRSFDERLLSQYFMRTADGGQEPQKIKGAVSNLLQKDLHYGSESKLERFDFLSTNVYSPGDYAEVQTDESWYIPSYYSDGTKETKIKTRYQVKPTYYLKKLAGKWLIEENTTARKKSN